MTALRVKGCHSISQMELGWLENLQMKWAWILQMPDSVWADGKTVFLVKTFSKCERYLPNTSSLENPSWSAHVSALFRAQDFTDQWVQLRELRMYVSTLQSCDHCFNSRKLRVFPPQWCQASLRMITGVTRQPLSLLTCCCGLAGQWTPSGSMARCWLLLAPPIQRSYKLKHRYLQATWGRTWVL